MWVNVVSSQKMGHIFIWDDSYFRKQEIIPGLAFIHFLFPFPTLVVVHSNEAFWFTKLQIYKIFWTAKYVFFKYEFRVTFQMYVKIYAKHKTHYFLVPDLKFSSTGFYGIQWQRMKRWQEFRDLRILYINCHIFWHKNTPKDF